MMNSANAKASRIGRSVVGPFIKVGGGTPRLLITCFLYLIHMYQALNMKQS